MTGLDVLIILLALAALLIGSVRGLMKQVGSLCGLVFGIILSRLFGGTVSAFLVAHTSTSPTMAYLIGNAIVFLATYFGCIAIAMTSRQIVRAISLGLIDRLAGALLTFLKYMFLLSLALNFVKLISPTSSLLESTIADGVVAQKVIDFAPWSLNIISEQIK